MVRFGRGFPITAIVIPPPHYRFPAYDNSALSATQTNLANNTAFTWGHTVAGGYGIVAIHGQLANTTSDLTVPATVTFGGVPLVELGGRFANDLNSATFIRVFGGSGIPAGGQTVSVTFNQGGTTFSGTASSYTYFNVGAVGSLQTAAGSSPGSVNVPTAIGNVVWGAIIRNTTTGLGAFSLTQRQAQTTLPAFVAGDTTADTTSETVSASTSFDGWAAVGLDLIAVT